MIGDGETAALVSDRGSVDWLCLPRFDSPACFASLIGTPDHGHWSIVPLAPITESRQRYEADTLILETDLKTDTGTVRLTDFMPMRDKGPLLVRIVTGLSGKVSIRSSAALRFDYGHMPPWVERQGNAIVCKVGPDEVFLQGQEGAEISQDGVHLRFDLAQGERRVFVLAHRSFGRDADNATPAAPDAFDLLERTRRYWRDWIGRLDGHPDARAAKLATRSGMGSCQGRICGSALAALGRFPAGSNRPPLFPARLETLGDTEFT